MTLYSLYARENQAPIAVADRFHWSAALLPPVHALWHRSWAMLGTWVLGVVAIGALSVYLGPGAALWLYVVLAAWLGFAAPAFTAATLVRRGWRHDAEIIAADGDLALVSWLSRK